MPDGAVSLPPIDVSLEAMVPFQPDSLLGTVVAGRYRLSGHLASGGMAAVYVAEDTRERREVALKILQPQLARSPEAVRRFLCEGSIAGLIDHPNVVRVLDHGDESGPPFIAMELLEGEGLFDRLRREGPLPPAEVVAILTQVCAGLEEAHRQGVIHRDLKPENVFLHGRRGEPPVVKILDFGVAGGAHGEGTDAGLVVGTPEYLSPEQAFGKGVDARSDVYSVGVMAWRMLAGKMPFAADSPESLIRMQARDPVPVLSRVRPELSAYPELVGVIARACAKNPENRPQSAADLALELARSLAEPAHLPTPTPYPSFRPRPVSPGPAAPAPAPVTAAAERRDPDRSRVARIAVLVAILLGLGVAGAALLLHARSARGAGPVQAAQPR
jgi:serine/threonine-protein kinase